MRFDTIVGNPPYNNEEYINFVTLAKRLVVSEKNTTGTICMVTPAKWQVKGDIKNELFRKNSSIHERYNVLH